MPKSRKNSQKLKDKITRGQVKKRVLDWIYGEDPHGASGGNIPFLGPSIGANAPEMTGERAIGELQKEGLPDNFLDYSRVVRDASEAVDRGEKPKEAIKYAKEKAKGRWLDQRSPSIDKYVSPEEEDKIRSSWAKRKGDIAMKGVSLEGRKKINQQEDTMTKIEPEVSADERARRNKIIEQLWKESGTTIADKDPKDWTEEELREIMRERMNSKDEARKKELFNREREWFAHHFGDQEIGYDETGKMKQPKPIRPIGKTPVPTKTPDGKELGEALQYLIGSVSPSSQHVHRILPYRPYEGRVPDEVTGEQVTPTVMPDEANETNIVRAMQSGLNILSGQKNPSPLPGASKTPKLKEDGIVGPKTAQAMKKAVMENGTPKVAEALALGKVKETVKDAKTNGAQNLAEELSATFSPLIGNAKSPKEGFQPEGLALQDTLNDLGANLKDDGIVGPKTQAAFEQVAKTQDTDEIVNRFAHNLGFDF